MDTILKKILEGTATETGEGFFSALVKNLALALDVPAAWVTENVDESHQFLVLAFWLDGKLTENWELKAEGTPCETVLVEGRMVHVPDNIEAVFPNDPDLEPLGIKSYVGVPFIDKDGHVLGHLAVFDRRPMLESEEKLAIIRIFAARAASELRRIRAEALVREREEKLSRLLNTAPDAIVELDSDLNIVLLNSVAEKAFLVKAKEVLGRHFSDFLSQDSFAHLRNLTQELATVKKGAAHRWVPELLTAVCTDGSTFPAEATLSRSGDHGRISFTLILRNINDRLAAEEKIRSLSIEAERLKEEIRVLGNFDDIIGNSIPLMKVKGTLNLTCVKPNGVTVLKKAFTKAKKIRKPATSDIRFYVIGAPKYRVEVTAQTYKDAERLLTKAVDTILDTVKTNGGDGEFSRTSSRR